MLNKEVYLINPYTRKLVNEGVANVNDNKDIKALEVLRYELETFVCDGQYEEGLKLILETYLKNLNYANQPAVWVSGFYGSGKSHLVKVLRALWEDTEFPDGATARGVANLPEDIKECLNKLSKESKTKGNLHAASGTLGSGASGSVRLALLGIIFKSVGLPEKYNLARFVMWLKEEGIFEETKIIIEEEGFDWDEELSNLFIAEGLHKALMKIKPNIFNSHATCVDLLSNQYPFVNDISNNEMVESIQKALSKDKVFPLTLVVLDEVQQFIGDDMHKSIEVQEVVETCCKNFGGKLLFVGTGQTAVTATANLKKIEGRFTVRVELSDNDVDTVVRKVILAKRADSINPLNKILDNNMGEISRHLVDTTIGADAKDTQYFIDDYPILPVRRRFWENTLRILDQTGTDSQLRNQLSMIHKVIQTNLNQPIGNVIAADFLYFDLAEKLLQARILPRNVYDKTLLWIKGTEDEQLWARSCGLVFLINKLSSYNDEIGIKANDDTLADLLIEDLSQGSGSLRSKLSKLLDDCPLLIKVGEEYRIQTKESAAWNDDLQSYKLHLSSSAYQIEAERDEEIQKKINNLLKKIHISQGISKVNRSFKIIFNSQLPSDYKEKVYIWIRDGWNIDENSVVVDAKHAGNNIPTIYLYIPKKSSDVLKRNLIDLKAATMTLEKRGIPNTPEGIEARAAIETIRLAALGKVNDLIDEAILESKVIQAGGDEILGDSLQESITSALNNSFKRLYPQFKLADYGNWDKVYSKAKQGDPEALREVDYNGEVTNHPVCKMILNFIASGKNGNELRNKFEKDVYGWPGDAVDGALQVLMVANLVRAVNERGEIINAKELDRKSIGRTIFKVESITITTPQRIKVRKLLQKFNLKATQGEELKEIPIFIQSMKKLANMAGGESPKPELPDITLIEEIRLKAGNEQILYIYNNYDELNEKFELWKSNSEEISKRWPIWIRLKELLEYTSVLAESKDIIEQMNTIEQERLLIEQTDLLSPLLKALEDSTRRAINESKKNYDDKLENYKKSLKGEFKAEKLNETVIDNAIMKCGIEEISKLSMGDYDSLVSTLKKYPLISWDDRINALKTRFDKVRELLSKELEPKSKIIEIERITLRTQEDVEEWLSKVEEQLKESIQNGPIIIS